MFDISIIIYLTQNVEDFDTCMYILIIYVFWKFNKMLI